MCSEAISIICLLKNFIPLDGDLYCFYATLAQTTVVGAGFQKDQKTI